MLDSESLSAARRQLCSVGRNPEWASKARFPLASPSGFRDFPMQDWLGQWARSQEDAYTVNPSYSGLPMLCGYQTGAIPSIICRCWGLLHAKQVSCHSAMAPPSKASKTTDVGNTTAGKSCSLRVWEGVLVWCLLM